MAFTVEDGSGVADANAYIPVAFADEHHGDRGNTAWTGTTPEKEMAIIRATDYVDKRFGMKFRGFKQSKSQGLEWPRLSAFDNDDFLFNGLDDIPRQLQKAVAEYSLIALQIDLLPIPARPFAVLDPATGVVSGGVSGQVIKKREKVDVIEEETEYSDNTNLLTRKKPGGSSSTVVTDFNLPEYPVADEWMQELLKAGFSVDLRRGN